MTQPAEKKRASASFDYSRFEQIDGSHPLKSSLPSMSVLYRARKRGGGRVAYFNWGLAREMGLISNDHPNQMNRALEKKILDTFSLVIINEYDIQKKRKFKNIKPGTYMATRYLQLQHPSKIGKTSGDGRSLWNGVFSNGRKVWDISSCGTGATKLSPATAIFGKYFPSGSGSSKVSYGCGTADLEDGVAAVLMSEIFQAAGYPTERTLAVIQYAKGESINVRASTNLLRPAHFFRYLKQDSIEEIRTLTDHFIERQRRNREWELSDETGDRYDFFLEQMIDAFARSAALFESYYIFCWLDWDGDNILASNAGILDYGSIRQFGLFHKGYRYDDVDRWSTTLLEQKQKARYIVQCFHQMIDALQKNRRRSLRSFAQGYATRKYDALFRYYKKYFLLERCGVRKSLIPEILSQNLKAVDRFEKAFTHFEHQQSHRGVYKVHDGVTSNAIWCMRDFLREYPKAILRGEGIWDWEDFVACTRSKYAETRDLNVTATQDKNLHDLQESYWDLVQITAAHQRKSFDAALLEINMRSSILNRYDRITGNSALMITDALLKQNRKPKQIFRAIEAFFQAHLHHPKIGRTPKAFKPIQKILIDNSHDI
jgi:uncharacterized protein YdiU (UPF0061 family)